MRYSPLFLFAAILFSACANRNIQHVELDAITVTGRNTGLDIYRASATRYWDISHTRVALSFDWKERTAEGRAWLDLHPYAYTTDSLVLDAKGMKIDTVMLVTNGSQQTVPFIHKDDRLRLNFNKQYKPTDSLRLYIRYKAMPYAEPVGGSAAISEDRGLYFINTDYKIPNKPAQIWTQGETEANSHWMPTIDKPNERFTAQIELTVPDSFTTLGNGGLVKQINNGAMRTDIWAIDMPVQTYAHMFAIGKFSVVKDSWKGKDVRYFVEPEYAPYARLMFQNTPEMMEYFSNITGVPYPWAKYDQVVVRDYVSGAMENTTASLFGEFMNQDAREHGDRDYEDIVAHELFHQWFGDYVTAESWPNLTLSESFANYSEQLWRKHKYGEASADELAYTDLWTYLIQADRHDPALVRYRYVAQEDMFDRISYQKGGATLNYLHGLIGDDAFFRAMYIYLKKNALRSAEVPQWRMAVEEATGQDWNWFFSQWYYKGGHPALDIKYDYNDAAQKLNVTITQKQDTTVYRLPLKAEVVYGNEKTEIDWLLQKRTDTFSYNYKNGVRPVIIPDSRHWLVGTIKENKTPINWLAQYRASSDNVISKRTALEGAGKKIEDTAAQALITAALGDKDVWIRTKALEYLLKLKTAKYQNKWKDQVQYLAVNDGRRKVRAAAFDVLGEWKIGAAKQDMYEALSDSSYMVAGAALDALAEVEKDTVYPIAKRILATNPRGDLESAVWEAIAERGNAEDINLFQKQAPYFYGSKKIGFLYGLSLYLQNVQDKAAFRQATELYAQLVNNESIGTYRVAMGSYLFSTGAEYRSRARDARSNMEKADLEQKLELLKTAARNIMDNEKDKDNLNQYNTVWKSVFGN